MITLTRYLSWKLFWTAVGVTLVFAALVQILDLLDATDDILAFGEGARGFAFYVVMRLPSILSEVLPLVVGPLVLPWRGQDAPVIAHAPAPVASGDVAAVAPAAMSAIVVSPRDPFPMVSPRQHRDA